MAEGADCGPVNAEKRRQPAGRKSRTSQQKRSSSSRVTLRSHPKLTELAASITVSSAGVFREFTEEFKLINKCKVTPGNTRTRLATNICDWSE